MRTQGADEVVLGRDVVEVDPGPDGGGLQLGLALLGQLLEAPPELGVAGVDRQQLAGLGVLHDDHAGVGQLELAPVDQPDRHESRVAALSSASAGLPPRLADEVGH